MKSNICILFRCHYFAFSRILILSMSTGQILLNQFVMNNLNTIDLIWIQISNRNQPAQWIKNQHQSRKTLAKPRPMKFTNQKRRRWLSYHSNQTMYNMIHLPPSHALTPLHIVTSLGKWFFKTFKSFFMIQFQFFNNFSNIFFLKFCY